MVGVAATWEDDVHVSGKLIVLRGRDEGSLCMHMHVLHCGLHTAAAAEAVVIWGGRGWRGRGFASCHG